MSHEARLLEVQEAPSRNTSPKRALARLAYDLAGMNMAGRYTRPKTGLRNVPGDRYCLREAQSPTALLSH